MLTSFNPEDLRQDRRGKAGNDQADTSLIITTNLPFAEWVTVFGTLK